MLPMACCVAAVSLVPVVQVKSTLGWEPVVPLKEGLALMIEDFAHRLGKDKASSVIMVRACGLRLKQFIACGCYR